MGDKIEMGDGWLGIEITDQGQIWQTGDRDGRQVRNGTPDIWMGDWGNRCENEYRWRIGDER